MHACGHDGHLASLLGAGALLKADPHWTGTVHLVFQPAEEATGADVGARAMIADGLFDRFRMDRIFGYHNWPGLPVGQIAVHSGPVMAAGARLYITIEGRAGHAALPHLTRDPVVAAGHFIVALQTVVSRNLDPNKSGVVSLTIINGGELINQIPDKVSLSGLFRFYSDDTKSAIEAGLRRVASGIRSMFDVEITIEIEYGLAATVNTPVEANMAAEAVLDAGFALRRDLEPAMTGEDFAYMLKERPGAFVWIGNGDSAELHSPKYDYNDSILPIAAGYLAAVAKRALHSP